MQISTFVLSRAALAALVLTPTLHAANGGGANGTTQRVSLTSLGTQVFSHSSAPSISRDGQRVAFQTIAALIPTDTNGVQDIYLYDRLSSSVTLVSTNVAGNLLNGESRYASISGDGQWVAFETDASNAIGFDTNGDPDVLLKNLAAGTIERVSSMPGSFFAGSASARHPHVSNDGRFVVFETFADEYSAADTNNDWDVYLYDRQLDTHQLVSIGMFAAGNASSTRPVVSDNGRYVAFRSYASNLAFNDTNADRDVFLRDLTLGVTSIVSRVPGGAIGNGESNGASLSADGRYVAFETHSTNFVMGDGNGSSDVYLWDRVANHLRLMSGAPNAAFTVSSGGSKPALSADGRTIAFISAAPDITADASPFLAVYVREIASGVTRMASRATGPDGQPNAASYSLSLNGDGSVLAFESGASNLVTGDVNATYDVFVRTLYADPIAYCTSSFTSAGCEPSLKSSGLPRVSADSGFVVTCEEAPNNKFGLLFYGFDGRQSVPFGGGTHCVVTPTVRTAPTFSGGNPFPANDCSGSFSVDMNAFAKGLLGIAPAPELSAVGQRVNVQFWGRDPHGPVSTTFLSNALEYVVGP